jgi:hypothetical protein
MALRRVHDGGVVAVADGYVDHHHPISGDVAHALDRLIRTGCLGLGTPDSLGHRRVCVTTAGQSRYAQLGEAFGAPESPDVVIGMRLLDTAKHHGFRFHRTGAGPDAPLCGVRRPSSGGTSSISVGYRRGAAPAAKA